MYANIGVTPFADIVLLSFNSATAILFQVVLALIFLNEVFICKYDLPALFLIILGSCLLILTANFSEVPNTVEELKHKLSSIKSICFFSFVFLLLNVTICVLKQ